MYILPVPGGCQLFHHGDSLGEIVEDLIGRLKQGDHNLLSGVTSLTGRWQTPQEIQHYRMPSTISDNQTVSHCYLILRMLECFPPRKCVVKWTAWFLHKNQLYRDSEEEERLVQRHQNGTSRKACKKET